MGSRSHRAAVLAAATAVLALVMFVTEDLRRVVEDPRGHVDRALGPYEFRAGSWIAEPWTRKPGCPGRGEHQSRRDAR